MFIKSNIPIFMFFAIVLTADAQQASFIYIQTENNLSCKAELRGVSYGASSTGYLVIPQVPAGNHTLNIFFSAEISKPYSFTVEVTDKPRGFSLRQTMQNQWVLFDMVSFSQIAGKEILPAARPKPVYEELVSPLAEKISVITPVKKGPEPMPVKKETAPVAKVRIPATTAIRKIFDKGSSSGIDQVYVIITGNRADTLALFIPVLEPEIRQTAHVRLSKSIHAAKTVKSGSLVSRSIFLLPETLF